MYLMLVVSLLMKLHDPVDSGFQGFTQKFLFCFLDDDICTFIQKCGKMWIRICFLDVKFITEILQWKHRKIHPPSISFLELVRTIITAFLECEVFTGEVIRMLDASFLILSHLLVVCRTTSPTKFHGAKSPVEAFSSHQPWPNMGYLTLLLSGHITKQVALCGPIRTLRAHAQLQLSTSWPSGNSHSPIGESQIMGTGWLLTLSLS